MAFDDNGDRMFAEYEVINVRDHQRKKIVGKLLYDTVCHVLNDLFVQSRKCVALLGLVAWRSAERNHSEENQ